MTETIGGGAKKTGRRGGSRRENGESRGLFPKQKKYRWMGQAKSETRQGTRGFSRGPEGSQEEANGMEKRSREGPKSVPEFGDLKREAEITKM